MSKEVESYIAELRTVVRDVTSSMRKQSRWGIKAIIPKSLEGRRDEIVDELRKSPFLFDSLYTRRGKKNVWLTAEWSSPDMATV
jgi:hypothetical protein